MAKMGTGWSEDGDDALREAFYREMRTLSSTRNRGRALEDAENGERHGSSIRQGHWAACVTTRTSTGALRTDPIVVADEAYCRATVLGSSAPMADVRGGRGRLTCWPDVSAREGRTRDSWRIHEKTLARWVNGKMRGQTRRLRLELEFEPR